MSLERFVAHMRDSAPGFRCYAAGDRSKSVKLLARVENRIGRPASAKAMATFGKLCGSGLLDLKSFVELHDGIVLYCDSKSDATGIEFFAVSQWKARTQEMHESMTAMGFENDDMPSWFREGVVFGQIPQSANYFVIQPGGDEAGQVFYCDHDDFRTEPIATSFGELLEAIANDPPGFLYQCGCYARYSDGKTDIQWIPKEYIADCSGG